MRIRTPFFCLAISLAGAASAHSPALLSTAFQTVGISYVDGLIAVKIAPGKDSTATSAIKKAGGSVARSMPQIGWKIVKVPSKANFANAYKKLDDNNKVFTSIERVGRDQLHAEVNDPLQGQLWAINRIQMREAWNYSQGNPNVVVAIVDSGIDRGHPDLAGRVLQGYDFVNNDNDPDDDNSHGTHCAGTAAASTNNGIGVASAGYNVTILPVKAAAAEGYLTYEWEAAGIIYAADQGADVISMSFGGFGYSQMVDDAVQYAHAKGSLLVASAGNSNVNFESYPAALENVICVASSDPNDTKSDFSNYGPTWVDVAAPGNGILSSIPRSMGGGNPYEFFSGTSMACPQVSGVASLLISYAGKGVMTPDEITEVIQSTTDNAPGDYVKYGRINALSAISAIGTPLVETPEAETPAPYDGIVTYPSGSFNTADGVSATIQSIRRSGVGLTGSFTTSFDLNGMTLPELRSGSLNLSVTGDKLATIQVFFQDLSGTWKLYSAQPGSPTGRSTEFTISRANLIKYMTDAGRLNVMVRSFVPMRLASKAKSITKVDMLRMTFNGVRKPGANP